MAKKNTPDIKVQPAGDLTPWITWGIVALFGVYLAAIMYPRSDSADAIHYREFGKLPCQDGGRIKPIDTLARANLMVISHKQSFRAKGANDEEVSHLADQWALEMMVGGVFFDGGGPAASYNIFRIDNPQLMGLLNVKERPGSWRYSIRDMVKQFPALEKEAAKAERVDSKNRNAYEASALELYKHLGIYMRLSGFHAPGLFPSNVAGQGDAPPKWLTLKEAAAPNAPVNPELVKAFGTMLKEYDGGDPAKFNSALDQYRAELEKAVPAGTMSTVRLEAWFNQVEPFFHSAVLYMLIFVIACVSWLGLFRPLNRAAFWSAVIVLGLHATALLLRMYIQDRPFVFVTNLYSSAIFIGLGCMAVCLFIEFCFRSSIALAVGSCTAALSLFIAHILSLDTGDTMEMMQAVLDTNFWLATHVTCITMGYTAMFVTGFLGVAYIFLGLFTRSLAGEGGVNLSKMIYGVLCFAMFLSFTGTVLGGIWADQSWGRFWGWDPKENGALLIVIWAALMLHARWGGMVKARGLAVLAVLGNIVTSWSWFGTNLLGVGLHSYGFMSGFKEALIIVDMVMLAIAGMGLLPLNMWTSFIPQPQVTPPLSAAERKQREAQAV